MGESGRGESPEERIVGILEEIRSEMGEVSKATADMARKLAEMGDAIAGLSKQVGMLPRSWPPALIIREVETRRLVPSTDLRVSESYQLLLRSRGIEEEVRMRLEGQNMSRFFDPLEVELRPGSGDDQGWWVGELRPKDGFKEGGLRLFFSRKVEGTLKVLVNGRVDVVRPIVIRRPLSKWFYAAVATLLWAVVGLIVKALEVLTNLLSLLTFTGGVVVGVLSFIIIYMASKSRG